MGMLSSKSEKFDRPAILAFRRGSRAVTPRPIRGEITALDMQCL